MLEQFLKNKQITKYRKLIIFGIFLWNLFIYSIPLYLLDANQNKIPHIIKEKYAYIICVFLHYFADCDLNKNIISINGFQFVIDSSCIGYKSFLGEFALIMAIPTKNIKKRIKYAALFAILMFLINFIRIISTIILYYLFNINPFFIHNLLWATLQNTLIISSALFFYFKFRSDLI